jgi:MFS family permease
MRLPAGRSPRPTARVAKNPALAAAGGETAHSGRLGALSDSRYRRYWLGSMASVGGIQLVVLGQGWLIVNVLGGSAIALGLLGGATAVPTILITLFGGVLADRIDRRLLLMITALMSAALLLFLATLDATGIVQIWHVVVIAGVLGLVQGMDQPTRNAFFPALIRREDLGSAVALNAILWQSTRIVSPMIGGIAIALFNTAVVFYASAIGFIAMFVVLLTLRVPHTPQQTTRNILGELREGIGYIARTRLFAALILLTYAHMLLGMQYIQLMPLVANHYHVGSQGLGLLFTMVGLGAVSGTFITLRVQAGQSLGRTLLLAVAGAECLIVAFALAPTYEVALALLFLASVCNSMFTISSMTALQMRVPDALRGRVMGIHGITFSMMPLGGLIGGAVAAYSDVRVAIGLGALVMLVVIAVVVTTEKEVVHLDGRPAGVP